MSARRRRIDCIIVAVSPTAKMCDGNLLVSSDGAVGIGARINEKRLDEMLPHTSGNEDVVSQRQQQFEFALKLPSVVYSNISHQLVVKSTFFLVLFCIADCRVTSAAARQVRLERVERNDRSNQCRKSAHSHPSFVKQTSPQESIFPSQKLKVVVPYGEFCLDQARYRRR